MNKTEGVTHRLAALCDARLAMEKEQDAHQAHHEWEALPVMAAHIPVPLRQRNQWVCWRYEAVAGRRKPAKIPYHPALGRVDATRRDRLCSFEMVYETYTHRGGYDGIGFSLMVDDGIVGVDIDGCIDAAGELSPLASEVIELLSSYSEISPSGRGIRIFTAADLGEFAGRRKGDIELYNYNRYLTVTGQPLRSAPVPLAPRLEELRELYRRYLMPERRETPAHEYSLPPTDDDTEVLARMFAGKLGALYEQLYHGDVSGIYGRNEEGGVDESRADTLLFNGLAYYTRGDATQMRRILLSSPRAQQRLAKWEKRVRGAQTYLDYQIEDSIQYSQRR